MTLLQPWPADHEPCVQEKVAVHYLISYLTAIQKLTRRAAFCQKNVRHYCQYQELCLKVGEMILGGPVLVSSTLLPNWWLHGWYGALVSLVMPFS